MGNGLMSLSIENATIKTINIYQRLNKVLWQVLSLNVFTEKKQYL